MSSEEYRIIPDLPSSVPALQFKKYANALAEIIMNSTPQFVVGIFGGWGSGKTTLMQAIEKRLDQKWCIPVQFSAWRYEKEEHLIVPLLDTIREALLSYRENGPELRSTLQEIASTIGNVTVALISGFSLKAGVTNALELSWEANKVLEKAQDYDKEKAKAEVPRSFYYASFKALKSAFAKVAKAQEKVRIVVFVDDLDRCLPEGALDVLESMKLFFDLQGFVFVVGLDQAVVEWCIDVKYRKQADAIAASEIRGKDYPVRGSDYIKKIFQVPFLLAPVKVTEIAGYLRSIYAEAELPKPQKEDLKKNVEPHLQYLAGKSGINPREIKRYINAYTLLIKARPDLPDRNTILALQTIAFRRDWELVQEVLYAYRGAFIDALQDKARVLKALENLDERLKDIPRSFLSYVDEGKPGHSLLKTKKLDEYIFSGETTRSTQSHSLELITLIREAGLIRQKIQTFRNDVTRISEASAELNLTTFRSKVTSLIQGSSAALVLRELDDFESSLYTVIHTPINIVQTDHIEKLEAIVARIIRHLREILTSM